MEEASDNAMDIDSDGGSSDNIIDEQTNQPNEQAEKINLLEMPREILKHILVQLDDDKDLLRASHVCKFLASVAETAFARKYSDKRYKCFGSDELFEGVTFAEFISNKQQLEALTIDFTDLNWIDLLDGQLTSLKTFDYGCRTFTTNLSKIRLNSLETLILFSSESGTYARLLRTLECKQLKQLDLMFYSGPDVNDEVTQAICKFKTLASLRLSEWKITLDQLEKLAGHLPYLTKLIIRSAEKESTPILKHTSAVLSIFPKLSTLSIRLNDKEYFDRFASDVKRSIIKFHGRFADTKI